jgi:hypothetical protein
VGFLWHQCFGGTWLQLSAALKELGLVDTGVVVGEGVVQLCRSFAQSGANYSCRKVRGDRSHAGPRPSMNSSSDVKVTDLMIYGDSSMRFRIYGDSGMWFRIYGDSSIHFRIYGDSSMWFRIYGDSSMRFRHAASFRAVQFSSCSHSAKLNFVSVVFLPKNWV